MKYSLRRLYPKIFTLIILLIPAAALSDDTAPNPKCDSLCISALKCSALNKTFHNDEAAFNIAKKITKDDLTRFFCEFQKGLVLPKPKIYWE